MYRIVRFINDIQHKSDLSRYRDEKLFFFFFSVFDQSTIEIIAKASLTFSFFIFVFLVGVDVCRTVDFETPI